MDKDNNSNKVKSIWDKIANNFSKVGPDYWNELGNRLVEFSNIKNGARVLDIGMGRGASLFPALKKVGEKGEVIGIDFSEVMVEETYKDIIRQNINNAKVLYMDARNLEFNEECFDNVVCGFSIGCLLYSDDKLNGVLRTLKKSGEAAFSIWGEQPDQIWLTEIVSKYIKPQPQSNDNSKVIKFSTASDVKKILEEGSFKNIRIYEETAKVIYKDKNEWWQEMNSNAVRGVFENIEALGEHIFKKFKEEVFTSLDNFKRDEGLVFDMPVIYAAGCK